jgi:predicted NBD/HSP70 family sugar kinase
LFQKTKILRLQTVRGTNSAVVLQLLRRFDSLSRVELARHSGLSEATVSRIIAGLLRRRLVREDGEENSTGGRPATRLRLDERRLAFGVDIGQWDLKFALATLSGKIVESASARTPASPGETIEAIAAQFHAYQKQLGRDRIEGAGISVRGLVNRQTGVVELGHSADWVEVPIRDELQRSLLVPIQVDNNVRMAAIAEHDYGNLTVLRENRCLLFVMIDEGIGIGVVLDGKLYYGPGEAAGEFGQMVIADSPGSERHDRPGCWERLASNVALCERYVKRGGERGAGGGNGDTRTKARRICRRALEGNSSALAALRETGHYVGIGIANVVWGLNPDVVVIDATMNEAWPLLEQFIKDEFPTGPGTINFRNLLLRPSRFAGEGSILGAATLPFRSLFNTGEQTRAGKAAPASTDGLASPPGGNRQRGAPRTLR